MQFDRKKVFVVVFDMTIPPGWLWVTYLKKTYSGALFMIVKAIQIVPKMCQNTKYYWGVDWLLVRMLCCWFSCSSDASHIIMECYEYRLRQLHISYKSAHIVRTYNSIVNHCHQILNTNSGQPWFNGKTLVLFDKLDFKAKRRRCWWLDFIHVDRSW